MLPEDPEIEQSCQEGCAQRAVPSDKHTARAAGAFAAEPPRLALQSFPHHQHLPFSCHLNLGARDAATSKRA